MKCDIALAAFFVAVLTAIVILGAVRINELQATNEELTAQLADCEAAEVAFIAIAPEG